MDITASHVSATGAQIQNPRSPCASGPFPEVFKPSIYDPQEFPDVASTRCSSVAWGFRHFQWILAVYAAGVLIATSYASQSVYELGESFKDIIGTLNLSPSSAGVIDRAVRISLLVSWLLAGGSIVGAIHVYLPVFIHAIGRSAEPLRISRCCVSSLP